MKNLCYDIYQKCQSTSRRPVGRYIVPEITVIKDVVVLRQFYEPFLCFYCYEKLKSERELKTIVVVFASLKVQCVRFMGIYWKKLNLIFIMIFLVLLK